MYKLLNLFTLLATAMAFAPNAQKGEFSSPGMIGKGMRRNDYMHPISKKDLPEVMTSYCFLCLMEGISIWK